MLDFVVVISSEEFLLKDKNFNSDNLEHFEEPYDSISIILDYLRFFWKKKGFLMGD